MAMSQKGYEEEIRRLDVALRELKVKYDQFFAGALDRQPFELRKQVDRIIDRIGKQPPGKYALRFHFNSLVSRYNSFSELWGKTLRSMEEGDHRAPTVSERFGLKERLITRCLVSDAERNRDDLRRVHRRFVEARERQGRRGVSFDKFLRGIASQAERLRARHECGQIEVRLVESDDEVQVRARPIR